jgi:molybdate transport system substrate-binding protein
MSVKSWRVGLFSFLVIVMLIACDQLAPTAPPSSQQITIKPAATLPLSVAAAASLQKTLQEVTSLYSQAYPGQTINYIFAASGVLQQQIEQGVPVDVFLAAADQPMKNLQTKGLLAPGNPKNLLTNQLVLIAPKKSSISLTGFQQLRQPTVKRIAIGEPRTVPAGQYATEVLQNLGIWEQVKSKFVFGNNVKSVLTAVETGDVDAGVVYITEAQSSNKISIIATADEKLHSPIQYPIAVLKSSKSVAISRQYVEFLQSKSAKAVFKKHGFGIAKP